MSRLTEMAERQGRVLTELSELGLDLARGLKARAEAAQTLDEAQGWALAFHRISRSVRLTLALEVKLERERRLAEREDYSRQLRVVEARKVRVRAAVSRAVWTETEGEAAESLLDELDERLEEEALCEDFAEAPVEAAIARIREDLGLPANDAGAVRATAGGVRPEASKSPPPLGQGNREAVEGAEARRSLEPPTSASPTPPPEGREPPPTAVRTASRCPPA